MKSKENIEHEILQERRTLDQVLLSAVRTYRNGCNWRLVKELDDNYYLEYGCDGILINLLVGDEKLLYEWFIKEDSNTTMKLLSGKVNPSTILELLEKPPCFLCGGTRFRVMRT